LLTYLLKLVVFALGLLLMICGVVLVILVKPAELRSHAVQMASMRGGCGGEQFREAVLEGLESESRRTLARFGYSWPNEIPVSVVANNFAVHRGEYSNDSLFMINSRKGLRSLVLELLVSQEVLLDAFCAFGASGQRNPTLPDLIRILGVRVNSRLRACEMRAIGHVFATWGSYVREGVLMAEFKSYKKVFCTKKELGSDTILIR